MNCIYCQLSNCSVGMQKWRLKPLITVNTDTPVWVIYLGYIKQSCVEQFRPGLTTGHWRPWGLTPGSTVGKQTRLCANHGAQSHTLTFNYFRKILKLSLIYTKCHPRYEKLCCQMSSCPACCLPPPSAAGGGRAGVSPVPLDSRVVRKCRVSWWKPSLCCVWGPIVLVRITRLPRTRLSRPSV